MVVTVTKDNFTSEVLESPIPVLVDFWADWCPPCKVIAPVLDEISKEYAGKLRIAKVNVDDNQELAEDYTIVSIPTLILLSDKKIVKKQVGVLSKEGLVEMFATII